MIEWMQTHRKWLVVTIWIATIAFIGAGFVGWGQFQLSRKESVVAQVKDTEVTIKDWQRYYNLIYNEVNQQLNGNLDEATAKKLGLKKIALQRAIRGAILIQFAKDLGLYVTDEDVAKEILKIFKTKQNYLTSLKRNNLTPKDFEDGLKKEILVQKLLNERVYLFLYAPVHKDYQYLALEASDRVTYEALNEDGKNPVNALRELNFDNVLEILRKSISQVSVL